MRFFKYCLFFVATFSQIVVQAQDFIDTLLLNEIVVVEKVNYAKVPGQSSQNLTAIKGKSSYVLNLGEALEQNTSVNIRSYGLSGISTVSVRGAGASHTGVVWNGINIQNIQTGQFNFASLPIASADKIMLVKGGTGAQVGSGSIGGTVFIDNQLSLDDEIKAELTLTAGMLKQYGQYLSVEKSSKRFATRLLLSNSTAENDFTYINTSRFDSPVDTNTNGAFSKLSALSSSKLLLGKKSAINLHLWFTKQHTEDAGTMLIPPKGHYTNDDNIRSALHWEWCNNNLSIDFRSAYLYGYMKYAGDIVSNHFTNNQLNEISVGQDNTLIEWKATINQSLEWMTSTDLQKNPKRNRYSMYGIAKYLWKRLEAALIVRQEVVNNKFIPFTPAIGVDFSASEKITISSFVSRSYRLPSFNDLYWTGWGNPDLVPEDAINKEVSVKYSNNVGKSRYSAQLTAFHNNISDMIVWLPHGSIWKPENQDSVVSFGIEAETDYLFWKSEKFNCGVQLHYTWVKSFSDGYEMIYVPNHKGAIGLHVDYRGYYLNYNHSLTSFRYTNKQNTKWLDGFNVANLSCGKSFDYKRCQFKISGVVRNLYNSEYQVIRYYPMPPRTFEISLTIRYKH